MPTSNRLVYPHWSTSKSVTSRTAVYGPVRTVVWQGSVGDRRPYADQVGLYRVFKCFKARCRNPSELGQVTDASLGLPQGAYTRRVARP
jgi:hypothetical protein